MIQRVLLPLAALLGAAVLGGVVAVAAWTALDGPRDPAPAPAAVAEPAVSPSRPAADAPGSVADIVESVLAGVVEVSVGSADEAEADDSPLPRFPFPTPERLRATGSGFVLTAGHVVTNQHVVRSAETVMVRFHDGEEVEARVVGTDPSTDVALLELPEDAPDAPALPRGSASALRIGDPVLAIGSPFGLQGTVTSGIVSALERSIRAPNGFTIDGAIQTDAALNQGNSGGPLLDLQGRVVGMNAQIATDSGASAGIGYAIPIETVREVAAELERHGEIAYAYLGVTIQDADGGAGVVDVVEGSPADGAGLREGDVIVRAGESAIESGDDLRVAVAARRPGDELELLLRRNGEEQTVTVELGRRPASVD
jgi:S1-C subfamily serine protease